jgi:FAD/FMN-containing dehydrogenase
VAQATFASSRDRIPAITGATLGSALGTLRTRLSSGAQVIAPGAPAYNRRRMLLNRQFDYKPAVLVRCATEGDVTLSIWFARQHQLRIAIRSGGTSPGGFSSNDGGMVIDLSPMKSIVVDTAEPSVRVGGGVLLKALIETLGPTGLMVPVGECMPVGVPGLALGGGFGLLSRSHGLTCDNILEARVVTADGTALTASRRENPDLLWALRGAGGGNFGVVTSLTLRLHPVPPAIAFATVFWPLAQAGKVLKAALTDFAEDAPDELDALISMLPMPTGKRVLGALAVYDGGPAVGAKVLSRLTGLGTPMQAKISTGPYFKVLLGLPNQVREIHDYYKSGFVTGRLPDPAIDLLVDRFASTEENAPEIENMVMFELAGGAINLVPPTATAFVHRHHTLLLSLVATWKGAAGEPNPPEKRWADDLYAALAPYYSGEVYQNYPDLELGDPLRAYYGENLERLMAVKRQFDPENAFRFAQGIPPS